MTLTDPQTTASGQPSREMTREEKRFIGAHLLVAIVALGVGSAFGPLQALEFSGVDLYQYIEPLFKSYYQGLTIHGVLNALVWTTFFIVGFTCFTTIKGLGRPLSKPIINKVGFWTMVVGLVTVSYTHLRAHETRR